MKEKLTWLKNLFIKGIIYAKFVNAFSHLCLHFSSSNISIHLFFRDSKILFQLSHEEEIHFCFLWFFCKGWIFNFLNDQKKNWIENFKTKTKKFFELQCEFFKSKRLIKKKNSKASIPSQISPVYTFQKRVFFNSFLFFAYSNTKCLL